jgi:Exonuclease
LIRVIDIETTGLDPASDAIIEIASVDMVRDGGITNAMDTLVRSGRSIPPGASAIHHIIDEDLKDAPLLTEVIDRFKGADAYVAHNCGFENSSSPPKASSSAPGSAPTNARCASGPISMATATRSSATLSAARRRILVCYAFAKRLGIGAKRRLRA